jgi:hypothetical protein
MPQNGYGYATLPEFQGITETQQQDYSDSMAKQRQLYQAGAARSGGMQSSGAYLGGLATMGAQEGKGLSAIERENQYKNALLSIEDRRTKEGRDFTREMSDIQWQRQQEMMKQQQDMQMQQALFGGLGSLAGMGLSAGLSAAMPSAQTQLFNKLDFNNMSQEQLMSLFLGSGGNSNPYVGGY